MREKKDLMERLRGYKYIIDVNVYYLCIYLIVKGYSFIEFFSF